MGHDLNLMTIHCKYGMAWILIYWLLVFYLVLLKQPLKSQIDSVTSLPPAYPVFEISSENKFYQTESTMN
jgi:hypothetical protein